MVKRIFHINRPSDHATFWDFITNLPADEIETLRNENISIGSNTHHALRR